MPKIVTFSSSTSALTLKWIADADYLIQGTQVLSGSAIFSFDPQLTYAGFTAPSADSVSEGQAFEYLIPGIAEIRKGQTIYCNPVGGGGTTLAQLMLVDVSAEQPI